MNLELLLPLIIYLTIVFAIAIWAKRNASNSNNPLNEYFIGERGMGGFVLSMTLAATYASASSFIGGPAAAYQMGLGWVFLAMIQVPAAWLTLGVLGKKFAIEARRHNAITLNDLLYARYQNHAVVILASGTLLLAFFATMVVQFIGGARLIEAVTGLSYLQSLLLFAVSVGIYTSVGGFRAVVLTDTLQGIMMLIGTIALLIGIIFAGGSVGEMITKLHAIDPDLISPYGADQFLSQPFMLSFWVLVCFGVIGLPHAAVRCMSYHSSKALHKGMVISTAVVAFLMLGMHLSGALGRAILPDIDHPDQIMPILMITVLPPVVAGIFLAGPMAAIMSTIDSMLIQSSATLIKDLYLNHIRPNSLTQSNGEKKLGRLALFSNIILSLLVFVAAIDPPEMIIWLNLLAFGALQAVFFWPLILGLYWKKAQALGAISSMISGLGTYAVLSWLKPDLFNIHPIVPSLIFGFLTFVIGSKFAQNQRHNHTALTTK